MVSDSGSFKLGCRYHLKSKNFCLCLCNYAVLFDEYPLGIGRKCMVTPPEALARATSNMGNRFLEPSVLTQHHQQCNSPLATFCSLTTFLLCGWASQWSCTSEVVEDVLRVKKVKTLRQSLHPMLFNFSSRKHPRMPLGTRKPPTFVGRTIETAKGLCPFCPPPLALAGSEWVASAKVFPAADFQRTISERLADAV